MELTKKGISKYPVNQNIFLEENDLSFYLLGAYMSDGCINDLKHHINFSINSKDKEWIENIRDIISPTKPIYEAKDKQCFSFESSNIDIINWLISYGCTPRKSKSIRIEKDIPKQYYSDFIRGLIDGDGSISCCKYNKYKNNKIYTYTKITVYICSASKEFLEQIKEYIPTDINCQLIKINQKQSIIRGKIINPTCEFYRLQFNESNAKKILDWAYYKDNKLSLQRKQILVNNILTG